MSINVSGDNHGKINVNQTVKPMVMINNTQFLRHSILPFIITFILLCLAPLVELPYGYFVFLRLMVCLSCACAIWQAAYNWITWTAIVLIVLYNPIIPVYLSQPLWTPINLITAILLLLFYGLNVRASRQRNNKIGFGR